MPTKTDDNLALWRSVERTDPQYTKPFSRGGGFRGTATNATYLAMKASEAFGPMGSGWGVEIVDDRYVEGAPLDDKGTREVIHRVLVKLWYEHSGKRGEIQQYGQTTFVGKNKNGFFTDEEHAKKSLTDGMSKCLSLLGFSADIHLGRYDDSKYVDELAHEYREKAEAEKRQAAPRVSASQAAEIKRLLSVTQADEAKFLEVFHAESVTDLAASAFARAKGALEKKKAKQEQEAA